MPGAATAEVYFIASMMVLILIMCGVAVFFFAKTYRKEMAERREREARKAEAIEEKKFNGEAKVGSPHSGD